MASGLQHLFEMPLPEVHESWKHIESMKAAGGENHHHSFTEIFAQLHLNKDQLEPEISSASSVFTLSPTSSLSSGAHSDDDESQEQGQRQGQGRSQLRRSRRNNYGGFPPPISCMGKSCLQPIRQNGRFILTEMRISTQEFLHACRENGRLKVHVVHSDEEDEDDGKLTISVHSADDDEDEDEDEEDHAYRKAIKMGSILEK